MSFTSLSFAIFFVILITLYRILPISLRKPLLLGAGLFFYAYWDWRFLGLMGTCIVVDYLLALRIHHAESLRLKRAYMALSVVLNLGLLGFFKYYNFFAGSASAALAPLGLHVPHLNVILPIGISFFTFESMSYTLDVYRGTLAPCDRLIDFALFIAFFPRLVAGPIIRAAHFLPQIQRPLLFQWSDVQAGQKDHGAGLVKKVLLADNLAPFVDRVYLGPQLYHPLTIWLATLAYALQIYYDFSGYSDMAVGIAKMFGFDLPINFSAPYAARNITEFWRRWHISLSTWLRDYLYISLGGNRRGTVRTYLNLMATMVLGGLWHGANWNFIVWGGLHGLGLAAHKWSTARFPRFSLPPLAARVLTVLFVVLLWVPFRASNWSTTLTMFHQLLWLGSGAQWLYPWVFAVLAVCVVSAARHRTGQPDFFSFDTGTFWGRTHVALSVMCLLYLSPLNLSPFVYFQF
jgi:alginate O-acetyltransferase complex protein AlgI